MNAASEAVAVIGMSGRFPGAPDVAAFWRNLQEGVESVERFTADELTEAGVDPAIAGDRRFVNAGAVLDDVDLFDASFFGYNPREAQLIDPQQRLFLECAWEAIEDAGYDTSRYDGLVGVYGGVGMSRYVFNLYANPEVVRLVGPLAILLGNDKDHLTTRVAYKLDLRGPAVTVQTACSSSLVAVCVACSALLDYSCDMALAGGSSINVPQRTGYLYQEGGISSPDGHCRAFAADAAGTYTGNGVGVVLLKRLSDAEADGDRILAVIKGSAVNNDGSLKVGYTAPSIDGQAEVIATAQAMAGVQPDTVTYVEAHGTGTPLGDSIEVAALKKVFSTAAGRNQCALGSVKSNIGHLDPAAGIAGLIKAVLAVHHAELPPTLHADEPNPKLGLADSPFYLPTAGAKWHTDGTPRRAGVSSFGMGGTNAHVVLEEAAGTTGSPPSRPEQVVLVSARTEAALDVATVRLAERLRTEPPELADVAHTTQVGRRPFAWRRAAVGASAAEVADALSSHASRSVTTGSAPDRPPDLAFLFPGQGSQHAAMAAGLLATEERFRAEVDRCVELLAGHLDVDLVELLTTGSAGADAALTQTQNAQPALFVVEYALARLLMSWGVTPSAMLGHSSGEYVAACLAGVLELGDALAIVAARGRCLQRLPAGAMVAVGLPEHDVESLLGDDLAVAAANGARQTTVSGPEASIDVLVRRLGEAGVACTRLRTSHAFHHPAMTEPVVEEFLEAFRGVTLSAPELPFVSNVTGTWITDEEATDPRYWVQHVRSTVRFGAGVSLLAADGRTLVEVGPGRGLTALARLDGHEVVPAMRHRKDATSDGRTLMHCVGRLWTAGADVAWPALHHGDRRLRVALPTYPFERQRHWVDPPGAKRTVAQGARAEEHRSSEPAGPAGLLYEPVWRESPVPPDDTAGATDRCLVFSDGPLGGDLVRRLRSRSSDVVVVEPGGRFERTGPNHFRIDPDRREDYVDLLREVGAAQRIVHLWSTEASPETGVLDPERFRVAQRRGFFSVLFLVQALGELVVTSPLELDVVTSRAHAVTGRESVRPEAATLAGPCLVVPQEYPHVVTRWIDVDGHGDADALLAELGARAADARVAWRGGRRFVAGVDAARPARPKPLRDHGAYLVTGAFGRLGTLLSHHLARSVKARLVLVARTIPPDVAERVKRLEGDGSEVLVFQADVGDAAAMRRAVALATEHFGDLHGVFHLAGHGGAGAARGIGSTDLALCHTHFAPKAEGAIVLDDVLRGRTLDFCALFSSLSTVLGGLGFVAHAAANAFLDAFVSGRPGWTSIGWDGWGAGGISDEDGMAVLGAALAVGPHAFVSTGDLPARMRTWVSFDHTTATAPFATQPRPALRTAYAAPSRRDEQVIAELFEALLGVSGVGVHDDFFELGGHSLLAIQLVSRLREAFRVEVSVEVVFDSPTVARLAEHVADAGHDGRTSADAIDDALDMVEGLSEADLEALLAEESDPEAQVRRFYDSVSASLDATEFGRHALFLNYGYLPDGTPSEAAVELPPRALNRASAQLVLELVGDCPVEDRVVLDVGCGRGGTVDLLKRLLRPRSCFGVDLSSRSLSFCASIGAGDAVCQADAQRLPFADASFDVVTNIESSHSYPDRSAFYAEVARVLRPGGFFLYTDNLPLPVLGAAKEQLQASGLVLRHERDVTRNVLLSCDDVAARRRDAFHAESTSSTLDSFLAVPGTTIYDDMQNGLSRYVILRLERS